jgi:hypothetical protein
MARLSDKIPLVNRLKSSSSHSKLSKSPSQTNLPGGGGGQGPAGKDSSVAHPK